MVARVPSGNTTQKQVLEWVSEQGKHLSGTEMSVLWYLSVHAFYHENNHEGGEVGQVLFVYSKYDAMMVGTGVKSAQGLRDILNRLQDKAYVQREKRAKVPGIYGPLPHVIHVLWELDDLRDGLRDGTRSLPQALKDRPTAPQRNARVIPLTQVVKVDE